MKTAKKAFFLFAILLCSSAAAWAQSKSAAQKGDEFFEDQNYIAAAQQYEEAYYKLSNNKAEKARVYFRLGECYRRMYYYQKAEIIFERLAKSRYATVEPRLYFYLAEMYRFENKIEKADSNYERYLRIAPYDQYARNRQASLIEVSKLFNNRTRHIITPLKDWNSPNECNDWGAHFWGNDTTKIVFTSSRHADDADPSTFDQWTGQGFSDLYYVYQDRMGRWTSDPVLLETADVINTAVNEGEGCFSPDGNTLYFSRCMDLDKKRRQACDIYVTTKNIPAQDGKKSKKKSKKTEDDGNAASNSSSEWTEPVRLNLGDSAYNFLYPAISSDGLTLYFSSDMPHENDGDNVLDFDIWRVSRHSVADDFGKAFNMGRVLNSEGDETFPILRNDTTLYYSSTGLPGVGGSDIFVTTLRGNRCSDPVNLGVPINSSYDDHSIIFYPAGEYSALERGIFSSNRPFADPHNKNTLTKGQKTPRINDDMFTFELPALNYSIEGTIRDEKSMQLVENAKVKLVGSDGSEVETYTDKRGYYYFDSTQVKHEMVYKMYVSKVDYFSIEGSESTRGYTVDKGLVHDFRLEPVPKQPVVLPEIRYDLAKWDLKDEFMDSLMDLYLVMVNNPGVVVEIRAHTDCRPFVGLTNDTLSQRRAQSVVDYLVSRGIERERMVAKGYAERVPRILDRDMTVRVNGKPYTFSEGQEMSCDYINLLPTEDYKDAAHQLNRRIEFLVLRTDYVSRRLIDNMPADTPTATRSEDGKVIDLVNKPLEEDNPDPEIIHDESVVEVTMINSAKGEIPCIVNGSQMPMLIDERFNEPISIAWEEAMNFLYQRRINKEDFPDRDNAFDPEGNILDKSTVIFKEIKIGQKLLRNVEVIVVKGIDYKFIINRTGLSKFGQYEFDKQLGKLFFVD